ncbi:MAG TPA: alpha/beta hydrolase-fold protein [Polyangia bacterium]
MHAVVTVELHARALGRTTTYTALVPDGGEPPFAVLYQLHGASDDHRAWLYRSNLLRHVEGLPLVVVMPSGENSDWVGAWERLVVDDVAAHVARTFRVRDGRAAIGGLSMGGYGAIRIGLKHAGRFASIFAHSSRLPARGDDDDVDVLAARVERASLPALAFDCGVEDHLLADSRRFHARLDALGLPHQYREHPGAHTWDYWDTHVRDAIEWHKQALAL